MLGAIAIAGTLVLGCSRAPVAPPPVDDGLPPGVEASFHALLEPARADGWFHAAAVAVATDRGVRWVQVGAWEGATGSDASRVEIGSVTKLFTATLFAEAVRRGAVDADATLASVLDPARPLAPGLGDVTLTQLATHTSGVPMWPRPPSEDDPFVERMTPDVFARSLATLSRALDDAFRYSNTGYALLALALSDASGMSYAALLDAWVTAPLRLGDTSFDPADAPDPRRVWGHAADGRREPPQLPGVLSASRALLSTPADLGAVLRAVLAADAAEAPAGVHAALAATLAPRTDRMATGWWRGGAEDARREHNGFTRGFFTYVGIDRRARVGVAFVADTHQRRLASVGPALLDALAGSTSVDLGLPRRADIPASVQRRLEGRYAWPGGPPITIAWDGALTWRMGENAPAVLHPSDAATYFMVEDDVGVAFDLDGDTPTALRLRFRDQTFRADRLP